MTAPTRRGDIKIEEDLIEEVAPRGQAVIQALQLAHKAAKQSPIAVRAVKPLIQGARTQAPEHWLPAEREAFVDLFDAQDTTEGVNAFLEKRSAQWKNS